MQQSYYLRKCKARRDKWREDGGITSRVTCRLGKARPQKWDLGSNPSASAIPKTLFMTFMVIGTATLTVFQALQEQPQAPVTEEPTPETISKPTKASAAPQQAQETIFCPNCGEKHSMPKDKNAIQCKCGGILIELNNKIVWVTEQETK